MINNGLTVSEIRLIESWCIGKSYDQVLEFIINEMDCTKETSIGRVMQTINARYSFLQLAADLIINEAIDSDRFDNGKVAEWKTRLQQRHDENLAFEKEHGVIQYGGIGGKKAKVVGKPKREKASNAKKYASSYRTKDIVTGEDVEIPIDKPKKETIKDRKTKELAEKFSRMKYNFNIKPKVEDD